MIVYFEIISQLRHEFSNTSYFYQFPLLAVSLIGVEDYTPQMEKQSFLSFKFPFLRKLRVFSSFSLNIDDSATSSMNTL